MLGDEQLEKAIYNTIRFYSLLDMPVTTVQIWRSLVVTKNEDNIRWHGHHVPKLREISAALTKSPFLQHRTASIWGYYFLKTAIKQRPNQAGYQHLARQYVRRRLTQHAIAVQKWKITLRAARWLVQLPFIRLVAGSGSLALFSTTTSSDLDLFIITQRNRIWTARLFLLLVSQLIGRRRKYWDKIAPDKICLNHYVTDKSLLMPREIRNVFTAQIYLKLIPLSDFDMYKKWLAVNQTWIRRWIMYPSANILPSRLYLTRSSVLARGWKIIEGFLAELPGDIIETIAAQIQTWAITKHTRWHNQTADPTRHDRIVFSSTELAFHPNTKVPAIIRQFQEEEGQGRLL